MENKSWTPGDILQLSGGYWSSCALHAGVKLDLFTPLSEMKQTARELADLLQVDARALAMLLNSLTALGLLVKKGGVYESTACARDFLSRTAPGYLGHIILHHHHLMAGWAHLDESIKSGGPIRERVSHTDEESSRESFLMGMFNSAMQIAPRIVSSIDMTGRRRLLDLGGGPGTYAVHFCRQNPGLEAVVYDLPTTRRFAEQTIARFNLSGRISFESGDFTADRINGRFDVAWLSHILHGEGPAECSALVKKAVSALEPGGMILVQEFILDDAMDGPLFPALFSLNMLLGTPGGRSYSQGELIDMLAAAGAVGVHRLPMDLPNGAGIIAGTMPAGK